MQRSSIPSSSSRSLGFQDDGENVDAENIPDKNGKTLPADLTSGSYDIRDLTHTGVGTLFEGKITYDKTYGHVTYGCGSCCGYKMTELFFNPLDIGGLGTADNGVNGLDTCAGSWEDVSGDMYGNWKTANTSIAIVDFYGTHTGHAIGSTTSSTFGKLEAFSIKVEDCPIDDFYSDGNDNVQPTITSITPDTVLVGTTNVQLTIDGYGFGTSPTVNLPQGVTNLGSQSSTNTRILVNVAVSTSAPIGPNSITVTAEGQASGPGAFTLDGPFYMTVQGDVLGKCSGCTTTVNRVVTYQVMNFSQTPASGALSVGENFTGSGWNCTQQNPGYSTTPCSDGFKTGSNAVFADLWGMSSDSFTPVGCGYNCNDEWQWCTSNPARGIGHLTGYTHTNAVQINGVTNPPNQFGNGTVINP